MKNRIRVGILSLPIAFLFSCGPGVKESTVAYAPRPWPAFVWASEVPLRVGPPETVRPAAGPAPETRRLEPVPYTAVKIGDAFWAPRNATRSLGSLRWIPRPQRRIGPIVSNRWD